jgi:diguanylate cyclase (GGDEF)-like protein
MRWLALILAIGFGMVLVVGASANPTLDLRAVDQRVNARLATRLLLDPDGNFDFSRARARTFDPGPTSAGEAINLGYRRGAVWLRLVPRLDADAPKDWLLELAYPSLDRVDLYLYQAGAVTHMAAGDLVLGDPPYPHRNLVFPLRLSAESPQEIYLRVETSGNYTLPITFWQPEALARADRVVYPQHAAYFGALLALLLYNLLLYLSVRDPLYLLYVGMVAGMGIGQLSLNGFGNLWLWPDARVWGNIAFPWGFAFCGLAGAMFTRRFLGTERYVPRLDRAILVTMVLFAIFTVVGPWLPYTWLAIGVSLTGLAFSILAVTVGISTYIAGSPGARFFLGAWTILLVGVGSMAARNLGWLPTNWWSLNLMQIGSALEMLLLSFALADRINILQAERNQAQAEAIGAKEVVVSTLRRSEADLEARVRERTEALTQANERLRASEERMRLIATHDPLTGLANRKLLDEELEHALARARRSGANVGVAFIDLNGFKAVNDQHGHDVGDQVLIAVAERLCCQVRAGDIVARLGGDEFVVVLESIGSGADLERRALAIDQALHFPLPTEAGVLDVAGSVGTGLFPDQASTAADLLRIADEAMYRKKKGAATE